MTTMSSAASRSFRVGLGFALLIASAICFLRYAGWAACYSGWYGLPSYAEKIREAGANARFYFWITLFLQLATLLLFWISVPLSESDLPAGLKLLARLGLSAALTLGFTAIFVLSINRFAMRSL
jgi:hypothetical protein